MTEYDVKSDSGEVGERAEVEIYNRLSKLGHDVIRAPKCYHPQWDMIIDKTTKLEVKHDGKAKYTGNIFIEWSKQGSPSGFSLSEADWYCICWDDETYFIASNDIKTLVGQIGIWRTGCGDGALFEGYTLKVNLIKPYLLSIKDFSIYIKYSRGL